MNRFKWISSAALLLASTVILGTASPARADPILTLTITDNTGSVTAQLDTTTHMFVGGSVMLTNSTGVFTSSFNPITGSNTLAFSGTIGGTFFDLSTAATTNTPGQPTIADLMIGSNTISTTAADTFSIFTSATGYTAPVTPPPLIAMTSTSGTVSTGALTAGTFNASADAYTAATINFAATGVGSVAMNPPGVILTSFPSSTPFTMSETLAGTLSAGATTTSLGGTLVIQDAPEPATVSLALSGLAMVGLATWRRKRNNRA